MDGEQEIVELRARKNNDNIADIWLMFLAFVLMTYELARSEHINPFASLILGLSLGSAFLFNKTTFDDLDKGYYYFHLVIVLTGILAIIYLWHAIINDRDDIEMCRKV